MLLRFNNLTAARFVAALLVFFHHSSPLEYEAMTNPLWKNFANNGHVGVSFFFILSGFVLAASNLDKLGRMSFSGTLSFYWKRIARIVPLWLVVSAPFILKAIQTDDPNLVPFLTFTQAWSSDVFVSFGLLAVAWTLSVEMFFYLTFPFIAAALRPFKGRALGPILTLLGLMIPAAGALYYWLNPDMAALFFPDPNSSHRWLYRFPVARLGEFIAGIGIFLTIARCNADGARQQHHWTGRIHNCTPDGHGHDGEDQHHVDHSLRGDLHLHGADACADGKARPARHLETAHPAR
ncbi:acyltransferase [Stenotrophomonas sp.]|uniref:acyltransferase family protein n=1 Tax=Stenotrophomonas sp. TaxID=69392 RepID=UPI00289F94FA|nr:acyltransferase [Stenotrophomonas sp.]